MSLGYDVKTTIGIESTTNDGGSMDSAWPMYCHDVRHTGRSPYSTADNPGIEKWRFETNGWAWGSSTIDEEGIIYIGAHDFYAIYPNGTLKWKYDINGVIESAAAIDEDGTIYIGTAYGDNHLYALYPDGSLKWKFFTGNNIFSSPVIGEDGTIYFGHGGGPPAGYINALYPDGTLRWKFQTNHAVYSSPAIDDGTVYCGSHDGNLYALYANNGTLKWKFRTGDWVGRGPCITDDGTIIFGSWDGHLYACYPNGTLKWKTGGYLAGTTPIIGPDGTIYVGNRYLSAINPNNGSVKWSFNPGSGRTIAGGNPCISADNIIYFGTITDNTGEIIGINSDGIEKWRFRMGPVHSAPAIGEDGTVYIGSSPTSDGYLHAFGELDINAPSAPIINGPSSGKEETVIDFTFTSTSPFDRDVYYYVEWGDGKVTDWTGPFKSGESATISHLWYKVGTMVIKACAKDTDNLWGSYGEFEIEITRPRTRVCLRFFNIFPILQRMLNLIK